MGSGICSRACGVLGNLRYVAQACFCGSILKRFTHAFMQSLFSEQLNESCIIVGGTDVVIAVQHCSACTTRVNSAFRAR